jgi:hypothetical protein
MLSSNILGKSNSIRLLSLLSFTSCFGEVSIVGYQPSTLSLVIGYKIRFHGAQDNTQEVRYGIGIPSFEEWIRLI